MAPVEWIVREEMERAEGMCDSHDDSGGRDSRINRSRLFNIDIPSRRSGLNAGSFGTSYGVEYAVCCILPHLKSCCMAVHCTRSNMGAWK